MNFEGKTVFLSGANRGIGRALLNDLLKLGVSRIFAGVRNLESLQVSDTRVVPVLLDLKDSATIRAAAWQASDTDILINNAGALIFESFLEANMSTARAEMEVNYFGLIEMVTAFLPALRRRTPSSIVNVVSIAAFSNFPVHGAYCASKAAAASFTQALRLELENEGVSVHAVHPGPIDTDMTASVTGVQKTSAAETAQGIVDGLMQGDTEIFPDPIGRAMFAQWKTDHRALEALVRGE